MARTSPKRVTRLDRQEASRSAASFDLAPAARVLAVILALGAMVFLVPRLTPSGGRLGGPLQGDLASGGSLTVIRRAGGGMVTLGIPVPWNAGTASVVLDKLAAVRADGVGIKRAGVAPPGSVSISADRVFPPAGVTLSPVDGYTVAPGVGELDGFQIVVGLSGQGTVAGFVLRYHVGDTGYVAFLPAGAMLCPSTCEGRDEAERAHRSLTAELAAFADAPAR